MAVGIASAALRASLGGCALTPRKPPPPELINSAVPEGFTPGMRLLTVDRDRFASEIPSLLSGLHKATGGGPLNILVLSGGGAGGAFGAGALMGLGKAHALPPFQVVTGVSASRKHLGQLFDYGEGCAMQGLLWTSADQALHQDIYRHAGEAATSNACPATAAQASR